MNADLDALATRLYVTIDDLLKDHPEWQPGRPAVGIAPQLADAELITLAVIQALLGMNGSSSPKRRPYQSIAAARSVTGMPTRQRRGADRARVDEAAAMTVRCARHALTYVSVRERRERHCRRTLSSDG